MIMFDTNILLSTYSSYKIGGKARYFFEAKNLESLEKAVAKGKSEKLPIFVLGGGTNLLISDDGFNGLVLKPNLVKLKAGNPEIEAEAGALMSDLLEFAAERGLSGLEWAGGLPGTLGGAIRGNAGAFGGEIKDSIKEVVSIDIASTAPKAVKRFNAECRFSYRNSIFKENGGKEIIVSAILKMKKGDKKQIRGAIEEKIKYRKERHPMEYPNIGSIFKNVDAKNITKAQLGKFKAVIKTDPFPVVPTAFLLSEAGLKGTSFGGAMISPKHPNFIVNVLNASADDVKNLVSLAKKTVLKKFGIKLEEEVIYV